MDQGTCVQRSASMPQRDTTCRPHWRLKYPGIPQTVLHCSAPGLQSLQADETAALNVSLHLGDRQSFKVLLQLLKLDDLAIQGCGIVKHLQLQSGDRYVPCGMAVVAAGSTNLVRAPAKITGSTSCTAAKGLTQQAGQALPHMSPRVGGGLSSARSRRSLPCEVCCAGPDT